jgi:palmitoyltransferase
MHNLHVKVTLLHWASINNRKELVNLYINHGAQVDAVGGKLLATPLHWAVRYLVLFIDQNE